MVQFHASDRDSPLTIDAGKHALQCNMVLEVYLEYQ